MNKITSLINQYKEDKDFTGGVDEKRIANVEKELGRKLPNSYKWFLNNYGHGGVLGMEVLGCALNRIDSVVEETNELRKYGLNKSFIVIENVGEYVKCLDVNKIKDDDCPVVTWSIYDDEEVKHHSNGFLDYLEEEIKNRSENI